jgi:simple sugar transport system ATP-binding protein
MNVDQSEPVLELSGIHKGFPGVKALSNVSLRLFPGEIHALMGQNGAGKSTLIKVLTGLYTPEQGRMTLDGQVITPRSTENAQDLGISTVYQEVNLCPNLSVAENICAGRFPRRWGLIDWAAVRAEARRVLRTMDLDIDVSAPLSRYPLSVQQMVAIARALSISARVLVLDEPTSSLDDAAVQRLFAVLCRLREQGLAILFVTHFLDQTYAISDRITVMRNGETEGEYLASELSRLALVNKMVGAPPDQQPARLEGGVAEAGSPVLRARGLGRRGALQPLDLELRRGEVLGLCGLLGSGRTEAARLLFGADVADSGHVEMAGGPARRWASPREAIAAGLAFCSEDRKHEGAILELSVRDNILLALQARHGLRLVMSRERQQALAQDFIQRLGIKTASADTPIAQLSGGNQQKALLARWLATAPAVLILDEPTRGIDVRAKEDLMDQVRALARRPGDEGMALVFISSELPEVLHCSDRLLVLRDRRAAGEYRRGELDEGSVLEVIAAEPQP